MSPRSGWWKEGPTERELDKASSRGNKSFRVLQGEQKWQPRKTKKKKKKKKKREKKKERKKSGNVFPTQSRPNRMNQTLIAMTEYGGHTIESKCSQQQRPRVAESLPTPPALPAALETKEIKKKNEGKILNQKTKFNRIGHPRETLATTTPADSTVDKQQQVSKILTQKKKLSAWKISPCDDGISSPWTGI